MYLQMMRYSDFIALLKEEVLSNSDIIKNGDDYEDPIETRRSIKYHLKKFANKLRSMEFVDDAFVDISQSNRGLSNYVTIVFNHPDDISKQEKKDYYSYTIRFSDHDNKHPKEKPEYEIGLVGRKVGNLTYAGTKFLYKKLPQIQQHINDFEIKKYRKVKTNLCANKNESIKLRIREE